MRKASCVVTSLLSVLSFDEEVVTLEVMDHTLQGQWTLK